MTLPRRRLALMLLTATAAAQDKDTGEGLVIAPRSVSEGADGAVVGSAVVQRMLDRAGPEGVAALVAEFRAALDADRE